MYDTCHPSYYYIEKLGCTDAIKISTTFYVYLELCEAKRYWEVDYKFDETMDLLYLVAKKYKNSETEIFIPWPVCYTISLDKIEKIQDGLNTDKVTFVFKAADSTSIIYRASKGLVKPVAPETSKLIKEKEERKSNLEREIRKNTSHLYELAKSLNAEDSKKNTSPSTSNSSNVANE